MYKVKVFATARKCTRNKFGQAIVLNEVFTELCILLNEQVDHAVEFGARLVQVDLNWLWSPL